MLQVLTGKYFKSQDLHSFHWKIPLYSNALIIGETATPIGVLRSKNVDNPPFEYEYEFEERLEKYTRSGERSVLVGLGPSVYSADFAAVLSFALDAVFSVDASRVARLTQGKQSATSRPMSPGMYVENTFSPNRLISTFERAHFETVLSKLLQLTRKEFEASMRAIRRYVTGLDRIEDDLSVAYTMFVASSESLAQGFDNFAPVWSDLDQNKRDGIDKALQGLTKA